MVVSTAPLENVTAAPPFTDSHPEGLDGVFRDDDDDQIISLVRCFNETVEVEFGAA